MPGIDKKFLLLSSILVLILLVASVYHHGKTIQPDSSITMVDFRVYYYAGFNMESGANAYDTGDGYFFYKYSPIFALLMSVIRFTTVTMHGALRVWYAVMLISLFGSIFLIREMLSRDRINNGRLRFFEIVPLIFIFRYMVVNSFIAPYIQSHWPLPLRIFDCIFLWIVLPFFVISLIVVRKNIKDDRHLVIALYLAVLFILRFVILNIDRAQINIPVMFFLLFFAYYEIRKKYVLSGIYLAVATALKLTPGIFLIYLVVKKRYMALFTALVSFIALLALPAFKIGFGRNVELLTGWLGALKRTFPTEYLQYKNQSIMSAVSRFFSKNSDIAFLRLENGYMTAIIIAVYAAIILTAIYSIVKRNGNGHHNNAPYDLSLFFVSMTILSPVGTKTTFVYLLFPLALLIKEAFARNLKDKFLNTGLATFLFLTYINSGDIIGDFSIILHKYSLMTFCLLIVFVLTICTKKTNMRLYI